MTEPFLLKNHLLWLEEWQQRFPGLIAGFSTAEKSMNVSYVIGDAPCKVLAARNHAASLSKIPLENWVFSQQTHSTHIKKVNLCHKGLGTLDFDSAIADTDGLYTNERGIVLATTYADCTPLYFYAPSAGLIGSAHAGWRGTVNGMMQKMIQAWKEKEHLDPSQIFIAIGPAISRDAYQVDDKVINEILKSTVRNAVSSFSHLGNGQYKFSPKHLNYLQAIHEGVPKENIFVSSYCTYHTPELFYSHRRGGEQGRMMAFIGLSPND